MLHQEKSQPPHQQVAEPNDVLKNENINTDRQDPDKNKNVFSSGEPSEAQKKMDEFFKNDTSSMSPNEIREEYRRLSRPLREESFQEFREAGYFDDKNSITIKHKNGTSKTLQEVVDTKDFDFIKNATEYTKTYNLGNGKTHTFNEEFGHYGAYDFSICISEDKKLAHSIADAVEERQWAENDEYVRRLGQNPAEKFIENALEQTKEAFADFKKDWLENSQNVTSEQALDSRQSTPFTSKKEEEEYTTLNKNRSNDDINLAEEQLFIDRNAVNNLTESL